MTTLSTSQITRQITRQRTSQKTNQSRNQKTQTARVKKTEQATFISALMLVAVLSLVLQTQNANAASASSAASTTLLSKTPSGVLTNNNLDAERRVSEFSCSLSAFMSVDSDEVVGTHAHFDGRGLVTCNNDHGFATEVPVLAEIDAEVPKSLLGHGELAISANSSTFVVSREINQLQDIYNARLAQSAAAISTADGADQPTLLLRGQRHDLVIEVKLKSATSQLSGLKVSRVQLRLDEGAPDLF
jgi:hypothetical protein